MQDPFRSFEAALIESLHERGLDPNHPITVAEIYQDLVPYRSHRDRLGVEMNGDYEHLLLRLLAGEGSVLELQSAAALEDIREELESNNPNTGLYREFAAVDVRLVNPGVVVAQAPAPPAHVEEPVTSIDALSPAIEAPMVPPFEAPVEMAMEPMVQPSPDHLFPEESTISAEEPLRVMASKDTCAWCRQVLPDRPNLNFCPFCGTDLRIVPCPSCGEALEPDWRFCIACGDEVVSTA